MPTKMETASATLVSDGRFFNVYDYLDRLSEVCEIVPGDQALAASSSGGTSFAQKQCVRCMKSKPVRRSLKELQALYKKAKDRYASFKAKANLSKGAPLSLSGTSSSNSTSSTGEMILIAYYGYDPNNRRAYRLLYETTTWWSYDGWGVAEEMDGSAGFFDDLKVKNPEPNPNVPHRNRREKKSGKRGRMPTGVPCKKASCLSIRRCMKEKAKEEKKKGPCTQYDWIRYSCGDWVFNHLERCCLEGNIPFYWYGPRRKCK